MRKEETDDGPTKFNLSLPGEMVAELTAIAERYGHGGKGTAMAAAMLALLEYSDEAQDALAEEVVSARLRKSYPKLVERAKRQNRPRTPPTNGPVIDVTLIDEAGDPVGPSPTQSPSREKPRGPRKRA